MAEALPADERPRAYVEQGIPVYRASAVGGCLRALTAARMGFEPVDLPEVVEDAAAFGRAMERYVIEAIPSWDRNVITVSDQQEEVLLHVGPVLIRGHVDGVAVLQFTPRGQFQRRIVEVKVLGSSTFEKLAWNGVEAFRSYAYQISAYMHGMHLPALYVVVNRDTVRHVDPMEAEYKIFYIDEPPVPLSDIRQRVLTAELHARGGELPSCDVESSFMCPFRYLCQDHDTTPEIRSFAVSEYARQYKEIDAKIKSLEAEKRMVQEKLRELVPVGQKAESRGWKVTHSESRRVSYDTDAMIRDFGEEKLTPYRRETVYSTLRVTPPKGWGES